MTRILQAGLFFIALALGALAFADSRGKSARPETGLPVGAPAPDFVLQDAEGRSVRLSDFRGRKNVALVFYPAQFRAGR
jgi:cytochrome oxidase Cu insertion factor (SCO1/SenC/PrrC family)